MSLTIANTRGEAIYTSQTATTLVEALTEASKAGVTLFDADLRCADLKGADLRGLTFIGADFRVADLRGAALARLEFCNLTGALLQGSSLEGLDAIPPRKSALSHTYTAPWLRRWRRAIDAVRWGWPWLAVGLALGAALDALARWLA